MTLILFLFAHFLSSDLFTLKKANSDGPSYCNMEPEKPTKPEKPPERKKSANELFLENLGKTGDNSQLGTSKQSKNQLKLPTQSTDQSKLSAQSISQSNDLKQSANDTVTSDRDAFQRTPPMLAPDVSLNGQYKLDDATANKYKLQCMTWLEMLKDQQCVSFFTSFFTFILLYCLVSKCTFTFIITEFQYWDPPPPNNMWL